MADPPLLLQKLLRPVTSMLLPKLYLHTIKDDSQRTSGGNEVMDEQSVEFWNEILLLLSSYSDLFVGEMKENKNGGIQGGKRRRRCCGNWYLVTTSLCLDLLNSRNFWWGLASAADGGITSFLA